jgi:hypothetical protein
MIEHLKQKIVENPRTGPFANNLRQNSLSEGEREAWDFPFFPAE